MKRNGKLSPKEARTYEQLCSLRATLWNCKWGWILTADGEITIQHQPRGEPRIQEITIPKRVFDKMVEWYLKPQRHPR